MRKGISPTFFRKKKSVHKMFAISAASESISAHFFSANVFNSFTFFFIGEYLSRSIFEMIHFLYFWFYFYVIHVLTSSHQTIPSNPNLCEEKAIQLNTTAILVMAKSHLFLSLFRFRFSCKHNVIVDDISEQSNGIVK